MLENPTADVQPILCLVRLKREDRFYPNIIEAYKYDTIGGNNSREAVQQLLKEHSELRNQRLYTHRLCSVYKQMAPTLALRMASKHNRATAFIHEMTTFDKVHNTNYFTLSCLVVLLYNMIATLHSSNRSFSAESCSMIWLRKCTPKKRNHQRN